MAGAALAFTLMVALVKHARAELEATEIMFWRSLVGVPLAWISLRGLSIRPVATRLLLLRVVLGFCAMLSFFTAAKGLALAEQSLIGRIQPLLIAVLAPAFLGADEKAEARTWGALALGLLGSVVLLAPGLQGGGLWGLWALASAIFSAAAHTTLRALGRSDHPAVVVLWFQIGITPIAWLLHVLVAGEAPAVPPVDLWPAIAGVGALAVVGQSLMTRAYQLDRAATVAGAEYSGPLWAILLDLLIWKAEPGWHILVGGAIIVLAGLMVLFQRPGAPPQTAMRTSQDQPPEASSTTAMTGASSTKGSASR